MWKDRHYYSRHDYESIPSEVANSLYSRLSNMLPTLIDESFAGRTIKNADDFSYTDPVDGTGRVVTVSHSVTEPEDLSKLGPVQ